MIRLTRPVLGAEEIEAVAEVLASGMLVQGARVAELESRIAGLLGRAQAVATSSGTSALELSLRAVGVGPGDDVLMPALTWPSPAHAVVLLGARPVLVDIDEDSWNATAEGFSAARTERTRAAIVIDQFGFPADHDAIAEALPDVAIVEDAACAIGARFRGRPCGSFGRIACLSFHPRKVITTGEGGMCLTDDEALADRLRVLRNHGQRAAGQFVEPAGNHRMTEISAAIGRVQLDRLEGLIAERRARAARYHEHLEHVAPQRVIEGAEPNFQTFGVRLPEDADRDAVVAALRAGGAEAGLLSYAIHRLPSVGAAAASLPAAEATADRGIALPLYPGMTDEEQDRVVSLLHAELSP